MKVTRISNRPETWANYLGKLWEKRSLIWVLAKKDLKEKYAQTALGLAWTILQPLTGLLIFTLFFDRIIKLENIPEVGYAVFAFTGMTSWYFFSFILYQASSSLINNQELIHKVSFPKVILPFSKVLLGAVDFSLSLLLLIILVVATGLSPSVNILFFPFFIFLNVIVGLSISLWLSALTVKNRDLQHIVPYVLNFGIWLTPVFYPATLIPSEFDFLLYLNPMAGIVEGYRWCLWDYQEFNAQYFLGIGLSFVLFLAGFWYFRKVEDGMADNL
ncbi:MAG: ABC transporter permease [Flavobacteriales bacterium]|nr:ABC transporter permease [Flavobacteriales bacterium]